FGAERQRVKSTLERGSAQTHGHHQTSFMRRAGDGESTRVALQVRVRKGQESEIGELARLELESLGLIKIERGSAGAESLLCLQAYFVGWHRILITYSFRCASDARGHRFARQVIPSINMTGTGHLLFLRMWPATTPNSRLPIHGQLLSSRVLFVLNLSSCLHS